MSEVKVVILHDYHIVIEDSIYATVVLTQPVQGFPNRTTSNPQTKPSKLDPELACALPSSASSLPFIIQFNSL